MDDNTYTHTPSDLGEKHFLILCLWQSHCMPCKRSLPCQKLTPFLSSFLHLPGLNQATRAPVLPPSAPSPPVFHCCLPEPTPQAGNPQALASCSQALAGGQPQATEWTCGFPHSPCAHRCPLLPLWADSASTLTEAQLASTSRRAELLGKTCAAERSWASKSQPKGID